MSENKENTGLWIPPEIWHDERLSPIEKMIYRIVASLDNGEGGCFASNGYIAGLCGCAERTVTSSVRKLVSAGYLSVAGFDGRHRKLTVCRDQTRRNCEADQHNIQCRPEQFSGQPRKKCDAASQNLRANNKENSIANNKDYYFRAGHEKKRKQTRYNRKL